MRLIKTFILRLNTDPEHIEQVCGEVQDLQKKYTYPFKNSSELINALRELVIKKCTQDEQVVKPLVDE